MQWSIIPGPSMDAAALQAGEMDWWEQIMLDLAPALAQRRGSGVERSDPYGLISPSRFDHLHPLLNNIALRRAVLAALSQRDLLLPTAGGDEATFRECFTMLPPLPARGEPDLRRPDATATRL